MDPGITRTKVPARTSSYFRSDLAYTLWKVLTTLRVMRVGPSSTEKSLTLTSAKCGFDAFVTVDGGLPYQRDLSLFDEQGLACVVPEGHTLFTASATPLATTTSAASIAASSSVSFLT